MFKKWLAACYCENAYRCNLCISSETLFPRNFFCSHNKGSSPVDLLQLQNCIHTELFGQVWCTQEAPSRVRWVTGSVVPSILSPTPSPVCNAKRFSVNNCKRMNEITNLLTWQSRIFPPLSKLSEVPLALITPEGCLWTTSVSPTWTFVAKGKAHISLQSYRMGLWLACEHPPKITCSVKF